MNNSHCQYNEKAQLTDLLHIEKFATAQYNDCLNETKTPELRTLFSSILEEEHKMANEVFTEMNTRGFYPVKEADESNIRETKDKYTAKCSCCK